jgi:SanA protein
MLKKSIKVMIRVCLYLGLLGFLIIALPRALFRGKAASQTFSTGNVPSRQVAIVFGAQVKKDGTPSVVLRDRVETAVALYKIGKVEKLLMSGDNRFVDYNEPEAMRRYAMALGMPEADIVLDYAGRRTYDTCFRAKEIFGVGSAVLVTQRFHLPRALFLCNAFGIDAVGVEAKNYYYFKPCSYSGIFAKPWRRFNRSGMCICSSHCLSLERLSSYFEQTGSHASRESEWQKNG